MFFNESKIKETNGTVIIKHILYVVTKMNINKYIPIVIRKVHKNSSTIFCI